MDNSRLYNESIILIGPSGAGKSKIAEKLHERTGLERLCLDTVAKDNRKSGFMKKFKSIEEHNLYMIREIVKRAEKRGIPGVVDFGGGHSVYDDENIFNSVKRELSKFKNVILLLPSADIEEALNILEKRSRKDRKENIKFLTSRCNRELATITIYENNKSPIEVTDEILQIIENRKNKEDLERE